MRLSHIHPDTGNVPSHSSPAGMQEPRATEPQLCLPVPPPTSHQLSACTTAVNLSRSIPVPSLFLLFSPEGALNPPAALSAAHLWLCHLHPCAHLCCCSGNNLWVGCRVLFPSSLQDAAAGEAAQARRESHGRCHTAVAYIPLGGFIPSQGALEMQHFIRSLLNCSNR